MPVKISFSERFSNKGSHEEPRENPAADETSSKVSRLATATSISAFVAVGCLVFAVVTHTQASTALANAQADMTTTVVAAKSIPSGATVKESMLMTVEVPSQYLSSGAVSNVKDAVGKQAITRIDANSQVCSSNLTKSDKSSSLAGRISKGKKAVSIDVSTETDFAQSLLHQGDRVSLYSFGEKGQGSKKLIAKNVEVLALDGYTSYADLSADGITASYSNVTVEVSTKTAEEIRQLQARNNSIWMVLTSSADVRR